METDLIFQINEIDKRNNEETIGQFWLYWNEVMKKA